MIFVSYHNIDLKYAFQLATLLIRYYRNIWLDRFEISPIVDWDEAIRGVYDRATAAIVIVSDDYLESDYCRKEYERLRGRDIPITAVIPRDFSTEKIAEFTFDDWTDFRRWFDEPNDLSVENLLNQIPQSDEATQVGERLQYLHRFIETVELALARLPTAWASLRQKPGQEAPQIRPRAYGGHLLQSWEFDCDSGGDSFQIDDLHAWASSGQSFIIAGKAGSGKTVFAQLLALAYAHSAIREARAPLPIWLDLMKWDQEIPSLETFVESEWGLLSYWKHWLHGNRAVFFLDNFGDLALHYPAYASELKRWMLSQADQRFVLLASNPGASEADLPRLEIPPVSAHLALRFATAFLTLGQLSDFRQIIRNKQSIIESNHLDFLSIGIELLVADKSLAVNQWQGNPLPALVNLRHHAVNAIGRDIGSKQILTYLQGLAWSMMQLETHRHVARIDVDQGASNSALINYAIDIGILCEAGKFLRFQSELYQWYLAIDHLKADGLSKYLTRPQFSAAGGRSPQKWDEIVLILVDNAADELVPRLIDQLAEIDPFLAITCLQRHPKLYDTHRQDLLHKLIQLAAKNPSAQRAFRDCVHSIPDVEKTAEALASQMSRFDNSVQLWLWHEVLALPLDLPLSFVEEVAGIDRQSTVPAIDQFSDYPVSLVVCYLVKLSQNTDPQIRAKSIWLLGKIKYLPSAILLLDYLESGHRDDVDEIVLALMKYAYSDILARLLRWSQDKPSHIDAVVTALALRGRLVSSRLLRLANEQQLTLNPEFYNLMIDRDELDLAIGLAQISERFVEMPETVKQAIAKRKNAGQLKHLLEQAIKHLPNRESFLQLLADILHVLQSPPESTVIAGSNLGALLYGQQRFDDVAAQAEQVLSPPQDAIPADLREQLASDDWQGRYQALNSLLDYPAAAALPHLLDLTNDRETLVRLAAYESLARFSDELPARKAITAALSDEDPEIVATVADLLQSMPGVDHDELLDLLDIASARTASAVIDILQAARYQPALAVLTALLDDGRRPHSFMPSIGQKAEAAIAAIKPKTIGREDHSTPGPTIGDARVAAMPSPTMDLGSQPFTDEEKILRTLQLLRDDDWGRAQKAAKFLRKFAKHLRKTDNPKILELLCAALGDENWHVRWAVVESLAWLQNPAAIPHLSRLLEDPNWIVQVALVRALVQLGARGSAHDMTPLLQSPQKAVREAAAEALGELENERVIAELGQATLNDSDYFVRLAALKAIHRISPQQAREYLEHALTDRFIHLRWYAMKALAPILDASDVPLLSRLLRDDEKPSWEEESVRDLAILALQRINSPESLAALESAGRLENRTDP